MAWLEGLSSLKGQITNFTKEVLSDGRDESEVSDSELISSRKKVEELEALCASQDLEITELRQRNAELQRRLSAGGTTASFSNSTLHGDLTSQNFLQSQDNCLAYSEVPLHTEGANSENHDGLLVLFESAKRELAENSERLLFYKEQFEKLQTEKQHVGAKCNHFEEQVQTLSRQLENESQKRASDLNELEQLRDQLRTATGQMTQIKDDSSVQLKAAELRIEELEKELQKVHQQIMEHLTDSQMNASEIRGEVEQTRWQLLQDSGVQKTELLRARQDMVNRIIQMGEKNREVEMNVKKLQLDGRHITADIVAIIHKLGDPEQQELIHGALKALELENQVLKLRNAKLELAGNADTLKGNSYECSSKLDFHFEDDEKKSTGSDNIDTPSKYSDSSNRKAEDDFETDSLKSEICELSLLKQKLESQILLQENKIEAYERDIGCFQLMKSEWSMEKKLLEKHLLDMKEQLCEKEEKLSLITAQKGLIEIKKQLPSTQKDTPKENTNLLKMVDDLTMQLSNAEEEKEQLQQGKICLSSEVEAMAKVVQDLETQLAKCNDENERLANSLEELDQQHQDAIDQLLDVKKELQMQNDALLSELNTMKEESGKEQKIDAGSQCYSNDFLSIKEAQTQSYIEGQSAEELHMEVRKNLEEEFRENISKLITFEIPKEYYNFNNNNKDYSISFGSVEALVKMCNEYKWKKDTLERKVTELMKEVRDTKHMYDERNQKAHDLENDCRLLKENVETLIEELMVSKSGGGEGLAPIPENSEETEALEQKIVILESEIEILREARSNLEADAKGLREENQLLVRRLEVASGTLRNQENLETEVNRWQEHASNTEEKLRETEDTKLALQREVERLMSEFQNVEVTNQNKSVSDQIKIEELQKQVSDLQAAVTHQEQLKSEMESMGKTINLTQEQLRLSEDTKCKLENEVMQLENKLGELNAQEIVQIEIANYKEQITNIQEANDKIQEELTESVANKTLQLEQATQKIAEHEQKFEESSNHILNLKEDIKKLEEELDNTKIQLTEEQSNKSFLQSELVKTQEVYNQCIKESSDLKTDNVSINQNLTQISEDKLKAERELEILSSMLSNKDTEIETLRREKMKLEEETERLHSAVNEDNFERMNSQTDEVEKWKEMAEASERQLSEALQVRDELEHECTRLYMIETRVQNQEHLERELERMKKLTEEMEDNSNELLKEKLSLEEQYEEMKNNFCSLKEMEEDATLRANSAEQQLKDLLQRNVELEEKCLLLQTLEEKYKNLEKDFVKNKGLSVNLQQELDEISRSKSELEAECKRLLAVEGKLRNEENLQLEVTGLKEKLHSVEMELDEAVNAKSQLENEFKILENACKLNNIPTQNHSQYAENELEPLNSREVLKAMEEQIQSLQNERQGILSVLDGRNFEIGRLTAENDQLMKIISDQKSAAARLEEDRHFQDSEATQMAKETVTNLSKIIKDKDMEIEALIQKNETLVSLLQDSTSRDEKSEENKDAFSEELERLNNERTELIQTVQIKHQESLQYHSEIQRLTALLNQEILKVDEIKKQYANLSQLYDDKEKLIASMRNVLVDGNLRIQQVEEALIAFKSQANMSNAGMVDLESKSSQKVSEVNEEHLERLEEVRMLRSQVTDLQNQLLNVSKPLTEDSSRPNETVANSILKEITSDLTLPEELQAQLELLQTECAQMTDSLLQEQTRNKYLQNEVQEHHEKENELRKDIYRLRLHLVEVEEGYTHEALKAEEQVKDLQNKLTQAEERIKNSSTAYTSASIRANQHVESLQGQARLIAQQRDDVQQKLSAAEDQVQHHSAALRNLQIVLEQFQKDKEREINSATERVQLHLTNAQQRNDELCAEIGTLKVQLSEAKEGLNAAARLGEQLDKKSDTINSLRDEVTKLSNQLQESENRVQTASLNVEGKVDRYLVKNLVLGYFMAPQNTRNQVLHIVATVLDFNQEERDRVGLDSGASSSGWFKSILQPGKGPGNMQSLSEAFVRFLENESRPQPQLRLLPDTQGGAQGDNRSDSPTSSAGSLARRSPLLLSEVHLPTFTQFPVGRNSSSILKDVLKDS